MGAASSPHYGRVFKGVHEIRSLVCCHPPPGSTEDPSVRSWIRTRPPASATSASQRHPAVPSARVPPVLRPPGPVRTTRHRRRVRVMPAAAGRAQPWARSPCGLVRRRPKCSGPSGTGGSVEVPLGKAGDGEPRGREDRAVLMHPPCGPRTRLSPCVFAAFPFRSPSWRPGAPAGLAFRCHRRAVLTNVCTGPAPCCVPPAGGARRPGEAPLCHGGHEPQISGAAAGDVSLTLQVPLGLRMAEEPRSGAHWSPWQREEGLQRVLHWP